MKHILISFALLLTGCLYPQLLHGQNSISGKVTDSQEQPLPYVSVQLLRADSTFMTGTATDSLGCYKFARINPSRYIVVLSSVGYTTVKIPVTVNGKTELPTVKMKADNVMLSEVVVKGASVIRQKDKLLILPDKQQTKFAGTGYDLLYNLMIPGVEVDRIKGKVNVFGGEATLYIDGRKADFREVQSLRPRDIEKVEYIDTPTGKYADDVAAINYVTHQYKTGGYVAVDGLQTIGYVNGYYNIVGKLSHGNTNYTLFTGYGMNKYDGDMNDNQEHFVFPEYDVNRKTTTLENKVKNNNQYAQLNIANQNKKHNLLAKISFVQNDAPDNHSRELLEYSGGYTMNRKSSQTTEQSGIMPTIDLYGYFNLKNNQYIETSLSGNYADNSYLYNYKENEYTTLTDSKENIYTATGNIKYGIRWKERNTLSVQAKHNQTISSTNYKGSNPSWQHLWTGQTIFFVEYSRMFGKSLTFKVAPGLSSLQYKLHGEKRISQISPRLNANLVYRISDQHQIVLSGILGNTQPEISQLNDAVQEVDSLVMKKGNPKLKPARFVTFNLSYSGQFKNFGLYFLSHYEGGNNLTTQNFYIENNKLMESFRDDVGVHYVSSMLSATWKASKHFRLKMDGYWNYASVFKGLSDRLNNFSGMLQVDYYWKNISFNLYGKTGIEDMGYQMIHTYEPAKYGLTAHWNKGNWQVQANAENLFTGHRRWKYYTQRDIYSYTNYVISRIYQRTGYVKVIYTLDFGKKTSRENNDVNRTINSAILKTH